MTETDDIVQNKTIALLKKIGCNSIECNSTENCKPFVASSVLFVCVSVALTGIMIYFYYKSKNYCLLPYQDCFFKKN